MQPFSSPFKSIKLIFCLILLVDQSLTCSLLADDKPTSEPVFRSLFDGKTLSGWKGDETFWRVEDGKIVAESTAEKPCKHNTFLVWEDGHVDNFTFRLKFKITGQPNSNSGIQFRSQIEADGHVVGYQADIDRQAKYLAGLYDEKGRGQLALMGEFQTIDQEGKRRVSKPEEIPAAYCHLKISTREKILQAFKLDDWNEYEISAVENVIVLKLNGLVSCLVVDLDQKNRDMTGILALQLHSGPPMKIEFKDLELERLPLVAKKKIVLVAGRPSHGSMQHEHNAGCLLLAKHLNESGLPVKAVTYHNGWPRDPSAFDNAHSIAFFCDGGGGHYVNQHLPQIDQLMKKGVGLVCLHYGVEVPKGDAGDHYLKWIGGYFETNWSVNPHWEANFEKFPEHPITRGVKPFTANDEWYYHMRFRENMEGVTPILSDLPPRETLNRPDGAHSGNPYVREDVLLKELPQHVAWAYQRPDGGRGFGFTGAHFHKNWQIDGFRTIVLNALIWSAGIDVPVDGVPSKTPDDTEINANLDPKAPPKPPKIKVPEKQPSDKKSSDTKTSQLPDQSPKMPIGDLTTTVNLQSPTNADNNAPEAALKSLKVYPGLEINTFASEPMLTNPTSIDIDHLGRVWVCEVVNYRSFRNKDAKTRSEGDRILILEDTDHDGKADKSTVFIQDPLVNSAHGVCVLGNRVIVSAGDKILAFYDDNQDLKADRHEVLFAGIKGADHDHGIHACVFGPDGKLYFNFGNEGQQLGNSKGEVIKDAAGNLVKAERKPYQEGMVFRCNLDGSELETLGWNFRNPWEICIDSNGTLWQSDNDDDGNRGTRINYVMPYGNYGYKDELTGSAWRVSRTNLETEIPHQHWHLNDPGVVPNMLQTGAGSPCGMCVYEGDLLPQAFRNQIIHCDPGPNVVRAYPTKAEGAGYTAEILPLVETTSDRWFRPVDIAVAPDGSVLIADWYDPGVGGHRMGDTAMGRIYRIAPPATGYQSPAHDFTTTEGLIKALCSPNHAARYMAFQGLQAKPFNEAFSALNKVLINSHQRNQARALWLIGKLKTKNTDETAQKLTIINHYLSHTITVDLTIVAIRLTRELLGEISLEDVKDSIPLTHKSPAVRREILLAMRGLDFPEFSGIWTQLAATYPVGDRWYLEALGIAAEGNWDGCLTSYLGGMKYNLNNPQVRDIIWRSRAGITPGLLLKLISSSETPTSELPRYFRALDYHKFLLAELAQVAFGQTHAKEAQGIIVAETMKRLGAESTSLLKPYQEKIEELLSQLQGTILFVKLASKLDLEKHHVAILDFIVKKYDQQEGVDAARILVENKQQQVFEPAFNSLPDDQAEKLGTAFGLTEEAKLVNVFHGLVLNQQLSLAKRKVAVKALSRTKRGQDSLLEMVEKKLPIEGLEQSFASAFSNSQNAEIRKAGEKYFPLSATKDAKPLPSVKELVTRKGDVKNGRTVYFAQGTCHKCHVVGTMGKEVGPNLSEIGKKLSREALYESILYPSAGISHNYESYAIRLDSGLTVTGLLISENEQEIRLKNEEGIERTIKTEEVLEKKKLNVSIMPADIQKLITEQELVDLVEYLSTLKQK